METAKLLVVGARGMAGADLLMRWPEARGLDLPEFDLTDAAQCRERLAELSPRVVVNCAAATAVDWCENHRNEAFRINGDGAGTLARACAESGTLMVQISTDYVFDGASTSEYTEDDPVNPLSVYAGSKLAGERAVSAATCEHLVLRIGWLFGQNDRSFVRAMLRAAGGAEPVRVIDDQVGCPTYSHDLAEAIERLVDAGARGIVHFTNAGACTRLDMARYIFRRAGFDSARIVAIKSAELPWVAARPPHNVLSTTRYKQLTGAAPRHWHDAIDDALRRDGIRPR
ncbi:MAG: dTDP-4-dehydrorhamnose reductase [Verrucomicrobia bacterium]|nr:dTDP-4-dehydrorhamnose reductase [Verrucomicrobiota bacterium]